MGAKAEIKIDWKPIGPITEEVEKAAMDRLETGGEYIAALAKSYCPVGKAVPRRGKPWTERVPEQLKRSIHVQRDDKKQVVRVVAGGYMPFYAYWVETGTVKMRAKPFMRPALRSPIVRIFLGIK